MKKGMERKGHFPDWLPDEIKAFVLDKREKLKNGYVIKFKPGDEDKKARYEEHKKSEEELETRLLTDPRMKAVWALFKRLSEPARTQYMIDFIENIPVARLDAEEIRITEAERKKIKSLGARISRQIKKLVETVSEVDELCSGPDTKRLVLRDIIMGDESDKNQLLKLEQELKNQLKFYNKSTHPRIRMFVKDKASIDSLMATKKRGQSNFVELFVNQVTSIFFKQWFNRPYDALAQDVSMVVVDQKPPKTSIRKNQQDLTRKRTSLLNSRKE